MKTCKKCGETKELDGFYRNKNTADGRTAWCSPCHKQSVRDSARRNPERVRDDWRRRKYGIDGQQYDALLKAQGGVCAICAGPPQRELLCIDHDHATGRVRGLLCDPCNTGIGHLRDDPTLLRGAIRYLEEAS